MASNIQKPMNNVLVIHEEGNASNNPSLISMLSEIESISEVHYISVNPQVENSKIKKIGKNRLQNKLTNLIMNNGYPKNFLILSVIQEILFCIFHKPKLLIGVDRQGLVVGGLLSQIFRIPLVYVSFEIIFEKESSNKYKKLERYFGGKVDLWIIQDEIRAQAVMAENNLNELNKMIIPIGTSTSSNKINLQSNSISLREKLGVGEDTKIAVMFGSLADWTMSTQIISTLSEWPKNWKLLIHHRYGNTADELISRNLSTYLNHPALLISEEVITDLSRPISLLSEVDAGIAFYTPTSGTFRGENIKYIGRASGKVSMFAKHGLPIITNENGLLSDDVREFSAGIVVDRVSAIPNALESIDKASERYRSSSYYYEILSFDNYSSEFRSKIEALMSR